MSKQLSPADRVTVVIRGLLAERAITRPFTVHDDLREVGLTSLDMVNLVLAVEAELGVSVPESEITPANFRTVTTILTLVEGVRRKSAA